MDAWSDVSLISALIQIPLTSKLPCGYIFLKNQLQELCYNRVNVIQITMSCAINIHKIQQSESEQEVDWKLARGKLETDFKQLEDLEADRKQTGKGLEADWKQTGSRLEADRKHTGSSPLADQKQT